MIPYIFYGVYDGAAGPTPYEISDNTGATYSGTDDTYLLESNSGTNFGGSATFIVKAWTTNDRTHTVLKFTGLSNVPAGTVSNGAIRLYLETVANFNFGARPTINAYALSRAFVENQATWNIAATGTNWGTAGALNTTNDYNNTLLGSVLINAQGAYFEITGSAVDSYINAIVNGGTDYGLLLVEANFLAPANIFHEAVFTSSEGADGQRPELTFDLASAAGAIEGIGASKNGVKNSTRGFKLATGVGASKVGSSANAIGQSNSIASSLGASKTGVNNSASGFKIASSIGASNSGAKSNTNAIKIAQSTGTSRIGSSGNAVGQQGTTASSIGASKTGVNNSASGFKIATGIGASCVGVDSSANGTKTTSSVGACKFAINSSANIRKLSSGVGATRTGFKSRPSSELFIATMQKKINFRGPEWITVSQGFWWDT